jgi:anti-sigma regulatory factor (Ser/Thr protein kinase)
MITAKITQESIDKVAQYLIWAKPEYIKFLISDRLIQYNDIRVHFLEITPEDYKEEYVYDTIERFFIDSGFSEDDAFTLKLGASELLVNAAKHVYNFEKLSEDGSLNYVSLDMRDTPFYVDISVTTKFMPLDISKVKEKMRKGRELSFRDSGRGFTLMNMFFDAAYVNHSYLNKDKNVASCSEVGLIKLKNNFVQPASYVK